MEPSHSIPLWSAFRTSLWPVPGPGQLQSVDKIGSGRTGLLSGEAAPKPPAALPPSHTGSATLEEMEGEEGPAAMEAALGLQG